MAATTAAAVVPSVAMGQSSGLIDAHCHAWSADLDAYPLAEGRTAADLNPPEFAAQPLLDRLGTYGIDRVVLIQHIWYHGFDSSYFSDMMAAHPGRFAAVGAVGEDRDDAPEMMIDRKAKGIRGFRVRGFDTAAWVDSPQMNAMFDTAAREGLAICPLIRNNANMDDGALRHLAALGAKHPDAQVVIDHMGTVRPDEPERLAELLALAEHDAVYVKVSGFNKFDTPPYEAIVPQVHKLIEAFGVERLMWGSDLPVLEEEAPNDLGAAVALARDGLGLSEAERDQLMRGTAETVFF